MLSVKLSKARNFWFKFSVFVWEIWGNEIWKKSIVDQLKPNVIVNIRESLRMRY